MQGVSVEVVRSLTSQDSPAVVTKLATAAVGGQVGRGHCKRQNGPGHWLDVEKEHSVTPKFLIFKWLWP